MSESSHLVSSRCGCDLTKPDIKPQEPPFPNLLNLDSHHVLPTAQIDIIHTAISAAMQDVSQLDQEISRLEAGLAALRRKHDEKQKYIMAHKALVSIIRQVPPEIITKIFFLCLRGCPTISPRLAAICRRWRTITFSSQVCATISLVVNSHRLDLQTASAAAWLSHSGEHPLSIDLRGNTSKKNVMHSLMGVFVARSEQWHTVHLSMRAGTMNCLLGAANRLHRLENLSFGRDIEWETTHISAIFATAPKLRSLKLFGLDGPIPQLPWKQLQELVINSGISVPDCLDIMKLTSNLLKCDILINWSARELVVYRPRSITLPLLRSMSLQLTADDWDPANFLSAMHLPVIEDLHISCDLGTTTVVDALLSMISDGTLVKLTLRSPDMLAPADMVAILRATPRLQELLLKQNSASCMSPAFLEGFNGPIEHLVPDLQKLEVDCYKQLDIFALGKMIEGRCLTNGQNTLKQVVLKCRNLKKDRTSKAPFRQIRDNGLVSGLDIQVLWHDNTPVDLDSF